MRKKTLVLSLLLACATAFGQSSYDLVIVGGNPGGIMAAITYAVFCLKKVMYERTLLIDLDLVFPNGYIGNNSN